MIVYLVQGWSAGSDFFGDGKVSAIEFVIDKESKIVDKLSSFSYSYDVILVSQYNIVTGDYVMDSVFGFMYNNGKYEKMTFEEIMSYYR